MGVLRIVLLAALAALGALSPGPALAQYPQKPIRLIVPSPPGGGPDLVARVIGPKLGEALGQPVVIENRVGGNGNLAAEGVVRSSPDGYTLLLGMDSLFAINPHLFGKASFDPLSDLLPISSLVTNGMFLVINPQVPAYSLQEFIDYAQRMRPPLHYASGGNGSQHHLTMERLKVRAGFEMVHVPYKGGSPATTATVAGEVEAMMSGTSSAGQIKAGRLRALAVTSPARSPIFPDVPSIAETFPGFEMVEWYGLFGPVGLPPGVQDRLRTAVVSILRLTDTVEQFRNGGGLQPWLAAPAEFSQRIQEDFNRYAVLVKAVGAKVD